MATLCLLRLPEVLRRTGVSSTDVYVGMKAGTFPQSVAIGKRSVAWVDREVQSWIEERIAKGRITPAQRKRKVHGPGRGHKGPLEERV